MIYEAKGIVLHKTPIADNKAVFHVYTAEEGLRSYMTFTSLRKEKKGQWMKMQPLAIVGLKAERKRDEGMDYLKAVDLEYASAAASYDWLKSSVRLFLNEALYKILQTTPADESLFQFIREALYQFDHHEFVPDFHLRFLWRLTAYLGCEPLCDRSAEKPFFQVEKAQFQPFRTGLDAEVSAWLPALLQGDLLPQDKNLVLPAAYRGDMLQCVLDYYGFHVTQSMASMQSHLVLKDILR
ncbi:MAG: recombination protein O N-terminal domain-containing protein [Bacteroidales bacterium]|nr:recombination protein O N-terminal domain-containing protein [Bacteroidales bacterium]